MTFSTIYQGLLIICITFRKTAFLLDFIVNLFGNGIRYWIISKNDPVVNELGKLKTTLGIRWDQLLFDLTLMKRFGIDHWSNLTEIPEQYGLMLTVNDRIEIKNGIKIIKKFKAADLTDHDKLFPLFNTSIYRPVKIKNEENILLVAQYETGLIAKYHFQTSKFDPDELEFHISKPFEETNDRLLQQITYNGILINKQMEDTVVRGLRVFEF